VLKKRLDEICKTGETAKKGKGDGIVPRGTHLGRGREKQKEEGEAIMSIKKEAKEGERKDSTHKERGKKKKKRLFVKRFGSFLE